MFRSTSGALRADVSYGLLFKVPLPESVFKMPGFTRGTRAALGFHTPGSRCKVPEWLHKSFTAILSLRVWALHLEPLCECL